MRSAAAVFNGTLKARHPIETGHAGQIPADLDIGIQARLLPSKEFEDQLIAKDDG